MYSVNDKKAAIRDLQRFLFIIGQNEDIPHLSIDGFYSEETVEAVTAFQRLHNLEEDGKVGRVTFDAIYEAYTDAMNKSKSEVLDFDRALFPLKLGDSGNNVSVLNSIIRELSRFYKDLPLPHGDFYSLDTKYAIRLLQSYFRKTENGETSFDFFNTLKEEMTLNQKT